MKPHLYFFHPNEFRRGGAEWFSAMSPRLLVMLDVLRLRWGKPIRISKDPGSCGRHLGNSDSQHNFDRWGEVRAVDVQPKGIKDSDDANDFVLLARSLGFTGVGFYSGWSRPGFHLDVRQDRRPGYPSTWGRVDSLYVSLNDAIEDYV